MEETADSPVVACATRTKPNDLYAARFVWAVWGILLLSVLAYISAFGYNIPFLDEYELVDALTGHQEVNLAWLWDQHNEHRIVLPRLLHLGLAWLTNTDFRAGMYFNAVALAGLAAAMIFAARRLRGHTSYVDAFFPLALLNYGHCENLIWSFQIEFVLSTLLACGMLFVVLRSKEAPTLRAILFAGLCLVGLPLTGAHGLPFVPPLAVWLVIWAWQHRNSTETRGRTSLAVALLLAGGSLFLLGWYFVGYKSCELHPPSSRLIITIKLMRQFLAIGCGAGVISWWSIARFMGLILISGSFVILAFRAWRLQQERVRCLGFMAFLVGMAGLAFGVGWGRGGIGIHLGFSFRYATLSVPWICCLFFMAQFSRSKWLTRCVQTALVLMMAILLKENTRYGIIYAHGQKQHFEAVVADLKANRSAQEIATKHPFLYPLPDLLASRLEKLRDAGIGPWGLMGSTRVAANTGTEKR